MRVQLFQQGAAEQQYVFPPSNQPDPSQIPLPDASDVDLLHGPAIVDETGHASTSKVAGSRRTKVPGAVVGAATSDPKGPKRKRDPTPGLSESDFDAGTAPAAKKGTHGGRRAGAGNYGKAELDKLLQLVERELPVGQTDWKRIHSSYASWASKNGHACRDTKAVEAKFKLVCSIFSQSQVTLLIVLR